VPCGLAAGKGGGRLWLGHRLAVQGVPNVKAMGELTKVDIATMQAAVNVDVFLDTGRCPAS
jgi:hypothetical protein